MNIFQENIQKKTPRNGRISPKVVTIHLFRKKRAKISSKNNTSGNYSNAKTEECNQNN